MNRGGGAHEEDTESRGKISRLAYFKIQGGKGLKERGSGHTFFKDQNQ